MSFVCLSAVAFVVGVMTFAVVDAAVVTVTKQRFTDD